VPADLTDGADCTVAAVETAATAAGWLPAELVRLEVFAPRQKPPTAMIAAAHALARQRMSVFFGLYTFIFFSR
jgi:hypothetical protein